MDMEIKIFPNSGHHYWFMPLLPAPDGREDAVRKALPQISFASIPQKAVNRLAVLCSSGDNDWAEVNGCSWMRWRFGTKVIGHHEIGQISLLGIWYAVESNLGSLRRGYIYERDTTPRQDDPNYEKFKALDGEPTPFAASDITRVNDVARIVEHEVNIDDDFALSTTLECLWLEPVGTPINVDLIVDFGNSRSVVLALEQIAAAGGQLSSICRPIKFLPPGTTYDGHDLDGAEPDHIPESWFILQEPIFSSSSPPNFCVTEYRTQIRETRVLLRLRRQEVLSEIVHRVPQMFVELSPAMMGSGARKLLATMNFDDGGRSFLSSPKRYAWDTDPVSGMGEAYWTMNLNPWNPNSRKRTSLPTLRGELLRYMPADGRDWSLDNPPTEWPLQERPSATPEAPSYPKADALTWAALTVIETAYRQIQSAAWRDRNQPFIPRRLRNILVTYPSGWTSGEIAAYTSKWQKAINIFTLTHGQDIRLVNQGGDRPSLSMNLDEAVASQLAVVYSEIHRMGDVGENWLSLVGRGTGSSAKARVMTIDIGGGTTDTSIIEYEDRFPGALVSLNATLLFKDSVTIAGDDLAKAIIEKVLLPTIAQKLGDDSARRKFEVLFSAPPTTLADKMEWSRIARLVFLPIVHRWFTDLAEERDHNPATGSPWRPSEVNVPLKSREKFNEICARNGIGDDVLSDTPLAVDYGDIKRCIQEWFEPLASSFAKYVAAFDCDMVIVTGKPSELVLIRGLLERHLPISPNRILMAKGYPAGDWFPMSADGRIQDAKLATAIGAALYQAIHSELIDRWKINSEASPQLLLRNFWGAMPPAGRSGGFSPVLLEPHEGGEQAKSCQLMTGMFIGRSMMPSGIRPEQVYLFRWRNLETLFPQGGHAREILNVWLRRTTPREGNSEELEIVEVKGTVEGREITKDDVELKVCTLPQGAEHWLDTGRFEVRWGTNQ